jgi:hypothetical protein
MQPASPFSGNHSNHYGVHTFMPGTPPKTELATPFSEADAALLLSDLRRLWRTWQERARSGPEERAAAALRIAMSELEAVLAARCRRRRAWLTLRDELARSVVDQFAARLRVE